jgi:hypothetical protein
MVEELEVNYVVALNKEVASKAWRKSDFAAVSIRRYRFR